MNVPMKISAPKFMTDWKTGVVTGPEVQGVERRVRDLDGVFADEGAFSQLRPDRLVYRTACVFPVPEGTEGGVFWGTTFIEPGTVGGEYFMTKGHFHAKADRMESYFTFAGTGLLVLMDTARNCWAEEMTPGSTHLIPPYTAHRTVNTGDDVFSFGACWPSDAGHDYDSIAESGFSARAMRVDGSPVLVPA